MFGITAQIDERTGYQEGAPWAGNIDFRCDFVMVYGTDPDMPQRLRQYKAAGYRVHLMTGISWGQYQDYLDGRWDGRPHWDEAQTDREGQLILHNPRVPYMVPTLSFIDYLGQNLERAVDQGILAIHVEEPEFWDRGGYSPAFKKEYEAYYQEPYCRPDRSPDAAYRCGALKAYLYTRAIRLLSVRLKTYARTIGQPDLKFYVPTHSLLNYTQWKIVSPEVNLLDIETVDGLIAQIWTGTSRTANVYAGVLAERTFDTAFLEYSLMQSFAASSGKRLWFLHDPIEDNPGYDWDNFRAQYQQTLIASLLQPEVWRYEICPWPHRVVEGVYPRIQPNIAQKDESSFPAPSAQPIPEAYRSKLSQLFQLLRDMRYSDWSYGGKAAAEVGILIGNSAMYQRGLNDGKAYNLNNELQHTLPYELTRQDLARLEQDPASLLAYRQSTAFPDFYGLALPLLKQGIWVRPLVFDQLRRHPDMISAYKVLVLSYEFFKPEDLAIQQTLAAWVRQGGHLIYVGDDKDPYQQIRGCWPAGQTAAQTLKEAMGLPGACPAGKYALGQGYFYLLCCLPACLTWRGDRLRAYLDSVNQAIKLTEPDWEPAGQLAIRRGPYIIAAGLTESPAAPELAWRGQYCDLLSDGLDIITDYRLTPGQLGLLYDLEQIKDQALALILSGARVLSMDVRPQRVRLQLASALDLTVVSRFRLPRKPMAMTRESNGHVEGLAFHWDAASRTVYFSYQADCRDCSVTIQLQRKSD
ncbi:MAG: hypothetical protein PHR21_03270 [Oscillospiraceae bacterium]|nr:hypothetical protein [Oscillospiraceae bacterium]MDD4367653.1 hypothetical protein [Oscillospiraceae bacterium]